MAAVARRAVELARPSPNAGLVAVESWKAGGVDREGTPSPLLVEQRIRNRIMEYLELASSFEARCRYQAATAVAYVPDEVINLWDDWNPVDQTRWPGRLKAPYSDEEIAAMQGFHAEW